MSTAKNVDSYKMLDYDGLRLVKTISGPNAAAKIVKEPSTATS